jgi:hypothetical protein
MPWHDAGMRSWSLWLLSLSCAPSARTADDGCEYESYEGTCVLSDVWADEQPGDDGLVRVEALYDTPRAPETVRHHVHPDEVERLRRHLAAHPRVPCRGQVIVAGTCEPSRVEVELPPLAGM